PDVEADPADSWDRPSRVGLLEGAGSGPAMSAADVLLDPTEVAALVREHLGGSALFGARFREAAARALLLPRRRPDRRQPLWQQRQRSAQLLQVASRF